MNGKGSMKKETKAKKTTTPTPKPKPSGNRKTKDDVVNYTVKETTYGALAKREESLRDLCKALHKCGIAQGMAIEARADTMIWGGFLLMVVINSISSLLTQDKVLLLVIRLLAFAIMLTIDIFAIRYTEKASEKKIADESKNIDYIFDGFIKDIKGHQGKEKE